MSDAVRNYPLLAGIQLDDHFAFPTSLGGEPVAMNKLSLRIISSMRDLRKVAVSLSPQPIEFSHLVNVMWDQWIKDEGYFDEYIAQLYTASFLQFQELYLNTLSQLPKNKTSIVGIGVRVNGSGQITAWPQAQQMILFMETKSNSLGICVWYVNSILDIYQKEFMLLWKS
jgi:uncharacterized lipoprotein YddW (UPF0748 family)